MAPRAIGTSCVWEAFAKKKNGTGCYHRKEPFGKDGNRKELLKAGDAEQQKAGKHTLHDERVAGREISGMYLRQGAEKVAVTRHREWDSAATHHRAVEADQHRK